MNRLLRFNRFRRLDRAAPRAGVGLPADVAAILSLDPEVYFDLRYTSLPGYGQILWQDAARTTPVTTVGDPIGSALNLGSLGGFATSSGTERPLFEVGFDGIDDMLSYPLVQAQPFSVVAWIDPDGTGSAEFFRVYASSASGTLSSAFLRDRGVLDGQVGHNYGSTIILAAPDLFTRGQLRLLSIAADATDDSLLQVADGGGVIGSDDTSPGSTGFVSDLLIGIRNDGTHPFDGPIFALALFGRRITAGDISSLPGVL